MERTDKRSLLVLSIFQITLGVVFLTLGLVDGFKIRYAYTSLMYTPCWIAALATPVGAMGLALSCSRRPSSVLINAVCSVGVASIIYSALTVYAYHHFGMMQLILEAYLESEGRAHEDWRFFKKDVLLKYTKQEEAALAVFGIIIILSIVEMIVAAAIIKISFCSYQMPWPSLVYYRDCQPNQDGFQMTPAIHNTAENSYHPAGVNNYRSVP